MRKLSPWYLLFVTALAGGSVIWLRDFGIIVMLISFQVSDSIHLKLDETHRRKWLIPCGIALALVLSSFDYLADLVTFPHSARAMYRFHDAFLIGSLWACAGLLVSFWSPENKRKSLSETG